MNNFNRVRMGSGLLALLGGMVAPLALAQERAPDDAQYSTARVQAEVRSGCDSQNRSSALVLECGCMAREAGRHLAEGKLARRTIAQQQFDVVPCIDRPRTADKVVALQFSADTTSMMQNAGVDVERMKACTHRAVAQDMPRESLTDFGNLRTELKLRCNSTRR